MEPYEPHLAIATAIAVGLLVGLEREQSHPKNQGALLAGVRTYPIFALIGALATLVEPASMWLPLVALAGVIALLAISYAFGLKNGQGHGVTTEASVIAVYLLGALAASRGVIDSLSDRLVLVVGLGVALTFLLSSKQFLHGIASRVSREDFYATVKFLIVAAIVVPLLPRRALGPLDAVNPFTVGLMVVTIAGLSFIGYVAMRWLGPDRGLLVGAAFGGLVSSTAVTIAFSGRVKKDPDLAPAAAGAIAIASLIMCVRVGVLVALINPGLLVTIGPAIAGASAGAALGGALTYRKAGAIDQTAVAVKNPFELGNAVRFGLLFGAILIATKAAKTYLGTSGLFAATTVGGLTDVDAVTLSTSKLGGTSAEAASVAIMLAVASNTIVKSTIALGIGGRRLGWRAFVIGGLIIVGGAIGLAPRVL